MSVPDGTSQRPDEAEELRIELRVRAASALAEEPVNEWVRGYQSAWSDILRIVFAQEQMSGKAAMGLGAPHAPDSERDGHADRRNMVIFSPEDVERLR